MQTLEQRKAAEKEQHRQTMARKRAAEKALLDTMRTEFTALTIQQKSLLTTYWDQVRELCQEKEKTSSPTAANESPSVEEGRLGSATGLPTLYNAYVRAVELGDAIHLENVELKERLDQHDIYESLLQRNITQLEDDAHNTQRDYRIHHWKQFAKDDELFYYEAVDASTCHGIIRTNYPIFMNHHARFVQLEEEPQRFFGWNVQRIVENGHHFHFSKRIWSADSALMTDFIGDEAWRVFNTPNLYERLYTTRVIMHVLQRVDANTSVALQSLPAPDNSVSRRCLTLASKIVNRDEDGRLVVTILLLGTTPNEDMTKKNSPGVQFVHDTSAYLMLHQRVDEYGQEFVEMVFSVYGGYKSDAEARFVFLESASALVRFEQMVLPQHLVTSE